MFSNLSCNIEHCKFLMHPVILLACILKKTYVAPFKRKNQDFCYCVDSGNKQTVLVFQVFDTVFKELVSHIPE